MIMTDHLIQRRPPSGNLLAEFRERPPEEYHGEVAPYYPSSLPATPEGHHGYAGGLLEHTVGVATICRETAQLHPRLRSDLLPMDCVDFSERIVALPEPRTWLPVLA